MRKDKYGKTFWKRWWWTIPLVLLFGVGIVMLRMDFTSDAMRKDPDHIPDVPAKEAPVKGDEEELSTVFRKHGELKFNTPSGKTRAKIDIEIAEKTEKRAFGLMFRESMEADHGMLFIFEKPDIQSFWMKNTKIPLDMLFVDETGAIVRIVENTVPLTEDQVHCETPALYVVEVNAGFSAKHGIRIGDYIQWSRMETHDTDTP